MIAGVTGVLATRPTVAHGVVERAAAVGLLLVMTLPMSPAWPRTRLPQAGYVLGHGAGVFLAHAWLIGVLVKTEGYSRASAAALVLGIALVLALYRLASLELLRRHCSARSPWSAGICACVITGADGWLVALFPFLEPLGLPALLMDLPGAASTFSQFGLDLTAAICVFIALAVLHERWFAAGVALVLFGFPAVIDGDQRTAGEVTLDVAVIQPGALPSARERRLELLHGLERSAPDADLYLWPEAVIEADDEADLVAVLTRPGPVKARVFGISYGTAALTLNGVVASDGERGAARFRWKERLAPGEARRVAAGPAQPALLELLGADVWLPICYELLGRALPSASGAQLILSVASDEFDPSGSASRVMTRILRLRSMELGIPGIRVSSRIGSAFVDERGQLLQLAEPGARVLRAELNVD